MLTLIKTLYSQKYKFTNTGAYRLQKVDFCKYNTLTRSNKHGGIQRLCMIKALQHLIQEVSQILSSTQSTCDWLTHKPSDRLA